MFACFGMRRAFVTLVGCALAVVGGLLLAPPAPVAAATLYYVGATGDSTTITGCTSATNTTCTLRGAISQAQSGNDTITFNATVFPANTPATITLVSSTLTLGTSVTIDGTGHSVVVDGNCMLTSGVCTSGGVMVFTVPPSVTVNLTALTIQHGYTSNNGGGIFNLGTLTVTNSTVSANAAANGGGGIYNTGTLTVTNSTLSGNSVGSNGGGINTSFGAVTLTNSTLSGNSARTSGGGIYQSSGMVKLTNTIVALNTLTGMGGSGPDLFGAFTTGGNNLIGTVSGSMGITNGTNGDIVTMMPRLGTLGNNGGPTQTIPLLSGSPARGAGNATVCVTAVTATPPGAGGLDQRGAPRPTSFCSIGAFEPQLNTAYTVGSTSDSGNAGTVAACQTPANTTCRLRDALGLALSVYDTETITFNSTGSGTITLTLANGTLTVAGNVTIDGTGRSVTVDGGNQLTVFTVNSGVTATLTALTIQHGNTANNGGGINNSGTLTVTNSTVSANSANNGGGINNSGTLTVTNGFLSANSANNGGGINNSGMLTVTNGFLSGNGGSTSGGGINNSGMLTVTNSILSGNGGSTSGGGGINNNGGTLTVTNGFLSGNIASIGGGINNSGGTLTVTNSTFSSNTASNNGGGLAVNIGMITVTNSTFASNTASNDGGGIYANIGTLTVTNSTLARNTASNGGGIYHASGNPFTLTNTIVALNTFTGGGNNRPDLVGPFMTGGHNLIGTIAGSSGIVGGTNGDIVNNTPLLGTLSDNGGPTQTIPLLPGSPAIANGDSAVCTTTGVGKVNGLDGRGVARPTTLCAIGAFEPLLSVISPASGGVDGGALVTLTGAGFVMGSTTVSIGGAACTNVQIGNNGTSLRCTAGAHAVGVVDVVVMMGGATGTLVGGYTYGVITPAPTPPRTTAPPMGVATPMPGARVAAPTVLPTPLPAPMRRQ